MTRGIREGVGSALCFGVLLIGLVAVDGRVRERFAAAATVDAASAWTTRVGDLGSVVLETARDQSIEHAPLLIFTAAAAVLVLFMLRT